MSDPTDRVIEVWSDDAALVRTVRLPWAEECGTFTLASYCNEVSSTPETCHGHCQHPAWDTEVVETACGAIRGMPGIGRHEDVRRVRSGHAEPYRSSSDPWRDAVACPTRPRRSTPRRLERRSHRVRSGYAGTGG